jgi:hypothetical protein
MRWHLSCDFIIRHYRALVRDADVEEYWRIGPTNLEKSKSGCRSGLAR